MQFHSGCALMMIESLRKSCCTSLKKRRVHDTCSKIVYHSAWKCKESLALIFIRHRCLHFRMQTYGGCLVVVKLVSLVASCGEHRLPISTPTPPTRTSQCFDWKGHTSNTTCSCPHYLCLRYLGPTGQLTTLDSSCLIMVCSNHGTKLCGMLITYAAHV